jgi:rhodanese-related sulfurtransferase
MFGLFNRESTKFKNISTSEFKSIVSETKDAVILDVRSKVEVNSGKIKGAKNIDVQAPDFERQIRNLDKGKTYLVYCRSGIRSRHACQVLAENGFTNIYNLKGGVSAWSEQLV